MKPLTLQALTWTTIAAAVGSALWLAAAESSNATARQAAGPAVASGNSGSGRAEVIPVALRAEPRHARHPLTTEPRVDAAAHAPAPR